MRFWKYHQNAWEAQAEMSQYLILQHQASGHAHASVWEGKNYSSLVNLRASPLCPAVEECWDTVMRPQDPANHCTVAS